MICFGACNLLYARAAAIVCRGSSSLFSFLVRYYRSRICVFIITRSKQVSPLCYENNLLEPAAALRSSLWRLSESDLPCLSTVVLSFLTCLRWESVSLSRVFFKSLPLPIFVANSACTGWDLLHTVLLFSFVRNRDVIFVDMKQIYQINDACWDRWEATAASKSPVR